MARRSMWYALLQAVCGVPLVTAATFVDLKMSSGWRVTSAVLLVVFYGGLIFYHVRNYRRFTKVADLLDQGRLADALTLLL